jgi:acetate kinase
MLMSRDRILVANIGSTSFKFRLFEMPSERLLARGGYERIGSGLSPVVIRKEDGPSMSSELPLPDHVAAVRHAEEALGGFARLAAVGFKPVMARGVSGTCYMDEEVLGAMEAVSDLFPAHNPPYIAGVRAFHTLHPGLPCIGTFETAFYDHLPTHNTRFPIPLAWERDYGVQRTGFHGASHRYVTERCAGLMGSRDLRLISCHLGGSSSMAAVRNGVAVNSSWGMTAQSGLPHNNRAGDLDCFAMMYLARQIGWEAVEKGLASEAGLKGMSGLPSGDMRDLREAAASGNADAAAAVAVFVAAIRKFLGQFLVELDGADAIIFTGGIGENDHALRRRVCADLSFCGLALDEDANASASGEALISKAESAIEVRVIPTNEEIVIARNAWALLGGGTN